MNTAQTMSIPDLLADNRGTQRLVQVLETLLASHAAGQAQAAQTSTQYSLLGTQHSVLQTEHVALKNRTSQALKRLDNLLFMLENQQHSTAHPEAEAA
jgi:hypothetical protein